MLFILFFLAPEADRAKSAAVKKGAAIKAGICADVEIAVLCNYNSTVGMQMQRFRLYSTVQSINDKDT